MRKGIGLETLKLDTKFLFTPSQINGICKQDQHQRWCIIHPCWGAIPMKDPYLV